MKIARVRKALVAVVSGAAVVVSSGLLHGDALLAVNVVLAVLGAIGVHQIPNES